MLLPRFDELVRFFDTVIPCDLLCSYVVVGIPELPGAQIHVFCDDHF